MNGCKNMYKDARLKHTNNKQVLVPQQQGCIPVSTIPLQSSNRLFVLGITVRLLRRVCFSCVFTICPIVLHRR